MKISQTIQELSRWKKTHTHPQKDTAENDTIATPPLRDSNKYAAPHADGQHSKPPRQRTKWVK